MSIQPRDATIAVCFIGFLLLAGSGTAVAEPIANTWTGGDDRSDTGDLRLSENGHVFQQNEPTETTNASDYSINVGFVEVPLGEAITTTLQFFIDQLQAGISSLVTSFSEYILGLPAPGQADDPSSWVTAGGVWQAVYAIYGIMSALAIAFLTPSFMVATDTKQKRKRNARFAELGKAAFFIILGIPITAFFLHFGHSLVMTIAPSDTEFFVNSASLTNLGIGIIFGSLLIAIKSTTVLFALGFAVVIYLLTLLSVALWPLFWATRVQPENTVKSFGIVGLSIFPQLILLKFLQVSILRFLYYLPIDTLGNSVFKLVATTIGIGITFIGLPYIFLTKLLPGAAMVIDRGADSTTQTSGETTSGGVPAGKYTSTKSAGGMAQSVGPRSSGPTTRSRQHHQQSPNARAGPNPDQPTPVDRSDASATESETSSKETPTERRSVGPESRGPR